MNKDLGRAQTIPGLQSKYMNRIRHQSQSFYTWQIYSPESSLVTPCNCKTEGSPGSTILNVWVVKCNLHSVFCPPKKVPTSKYEKLKKQKNGNLKWHLPPPHSGQKRGGRRSYLVTLKFKVLLTLICPQN